MAGCTNPIYFESDTLRTTELSQLHSIHSPHRQRVATSRARSQSLNILLSYALVLITAVDLLTAAEPLAKNDLLDPPRFIQIPGPNPLLVPDKGWESGVIETSDAFKERDTYYLYYHGKGERGYQIGVATSKHPLGPFERQGDQPLLAVGPPGSWDDKYVACAFIMKERSNLYYMYYSAKKEGRDAELGRNVYDVGVATADNPLGPWTKHPNNPLLMDFGFVGSVVKHNGRYLMFNSAPLGDSGEDYDIMNRDYGPLSVAIADDPAGPWKIHPKTVLRPGEPGEWDDAGLSEAEVFYAGNMFHMFYGAATRARQRTESLESIGYAYSPDGFEWHKYGRNPVATREAEPNAGAYAEVHTIFEPPFIYLYHTLRYKEMPEHAKGRIGFPWLEDIGVQVIAMQRPFSLDMPVLNLDSIAPASTTTFSVFDTKTVALGNIEQASLTVACRFGDAAKRGIRIHVRSSSDGIHYDTVDWQTFDVKPDPKNTARQSFKLNTNTRFIKVLVENLDETAAVKDVSIVATLKG